MNTHQLMWILAVILVLIAGWVDWRTRRIPNWLTVSGFLFGIATNSLLAGWQGAKSSVEGAGLALLLLLPLVLLRAFGAGDWKLMAAVGAFLGPVLCLFVLFGSILVSGLMAIVEVMRRGRALTTFRNMLVLVGGFFSFGLRAHPEISLDNANLIRLPFGVAVAVATLGCFLVARFV